MLNLPTPIELTVKGGRCNVHTKTKPKLRLSDGRYHPITIYKEGKHDTIRGD